MTHAQTHADRHMEAVNKALQALQSLGDWTMDDLLSTAVEAAEAMDFAAIRAITAEIENRKLVEDILDREFVEANLLAA